MLRFAILFLSVKLFILSAASGQDLKVISSLEGFEFYEGNRPILTYIVKANDEHKPYDRPHYIHPLYGLDGSVLTEDVPEDHPHHHGVFTAWHQLLYKGEQIGDTWLCENTEWEVESTSIDEMEDQIVLHSAVDWMSKLDSSSSKEAVVREEMELSIHKSVEGYRAIDFEFILIPLVSDIAIGGSDNEKGYGGFNVRLKSPENLIFNSEGEVNPENTAVQTKPWMDFIMKNENAGVVVMVHPENPGEHDKWILRNSKSMQNPVFPGREPVVLPSEGITLKYRVIVYDNTFDSSRIPYLYDGYKK
ncbi:DUF6807 family protein [Membranihabitans maritimus]|uniref:DUF6807 family protein n=1 Tax=Membranihabitans maritimus TaxID=2904244 RepID=UPI001F485ACB|nr:DUF6807 family protein [Membranihabitans maritimus]